MDCEKNINKKLLFFGGGNIAHAIIKGFVNCGKISASYIYVYTTCSISKELSDLGCMSLNMLEKSIGNDVKHSFFKDSIAFICVKPYQFHSLLPSISTWLRQSEGLVISVMAGITYEKLSRAIKPLCPGVTIIRSLPNIATEVGKGVWPYCSSDKIDTAEIDKLLSKISFAPCISEQFMDVVCALTGSGVAFVFELIHAMTDGALAMGLPMSMGLVMASATVEGAAAMALNTTRHPIILRNEVCSPGGTTIAGIKELHANNFASSVEKAIQAATNRAKELNLSSQTVVNQQPTMKGDSPHNPLCFLITTKAKKPSSEVNMLSELDTSPNLGVMDVDNHVVSSPMSVSTAYEVESDRESNRKDNSPIDRGEDSNPVSKKDKRERYNFRKWQIEMLETEYKKNQYPDVDARDIMVRTINAEYQRLQGIPPNKTQKITDSIVHTWFSNRRTKRNPQTAKRTKPFPQQSQILSGNMSSGSIYDEDSASRFHVKPDPDEL